MDKDWGGGGGGFDVVSYNWLKCNSTKYKIAQNRVLKADSDDALVLAACERCKMC